MTDIHFDTLAAVRWLEANDFSGKQAEAITEVLRDGITGGVATKADLAILQADVADLKAASADLKAASADLKADVADLRAANASLKVDNADLKADLKLIKIIGGGFIVAVFPLWLVEMLSLFGNGG